MSNWEIPAEVTILGKVYNTADYVSKTGIRRTIPVNILKSMISPFNYNRETIKPKVDLLKKKVRDGKEVFRAYPIFLANINEKHDLYDAHHLFGVDGFESDEFVSAYICWWVNPNDEKAKLALLRKMNADQSNWKLWDYLRSNSDVEGGDYTYLKDKVVRSISYLSANVIGSAYTGDVRFLDDHPIKQGGLTLTKKQKEFGDWYISKVNQLRQTKYASELNSYVMRYFASLLHKTSEDFADGVNDSDFKEFGTEVFATIRALASNGKLKKMNQEACIEEYNDLKNSCLSPLKIVA